jgi:hypothetical protein
VFPAGFAATSTVQIRAMAAATMMDLNCMVMNEEAGVLDFDKDKRLIVLN